MEANLNTFKFWLEMVTNIAAIFGVPIAVIAILAQIRSARFSGNVDNLWRLNDEWQTKEMRIARVAIAQGLQKTGLENVADEVREVLDFFETLGLLVRRGAVDVDVAWNRFTTVGIPYWQALGPWLARHRQQDETLWAEYEWLQRRLVTTEAKKRKKTEEQVREFYRSDQPNFLASESNLSTT